MSSENQEVEIQSVSHHSQKEEQRIGEIKESQRQKKQWPKDWKEQIEKEFNPSDPIPRLTKEEREVKKPNKEELQKNIKVNQEIINEKQKLYKGFQDQIKDYMFSDQEFQNVINQIKNNNEQKKELISLNKELHNKKNLLKQQIEELSNQIKYINSKFYKEKTWKKDKLTLLYKQKLQEYEAEKKAHGDSWESHGNNKALKEEITQIYFTLLNLDKAYELKIKKDETYNMRQALIQKVSDNQNRINQLTDESKELRGKNEEVKLRIEEKLKDNPLVQKLESQKKKVQDEIYELKKIIEEIKKDFNQQYEKYDEVKFKIAQFKFKEELKKQYLDNIRKGQKEQKYKERMEKDSSQKIEELKKQHDELMEKLNRVEELLRAKQNESQTQQEKNEQQEQLIASGDIIAPKKKDEIVYQVKHKKLKQQKNHSQNLFEGQVVLMFNMLELKCPTKVEDIEKTFQAIEKKRSLHTKLLEEQVKKIDSKKDSGSQQDLKKGKKGQLNEVDDESFPTL